MERIILVFFILFTGGFSSLFGQELPKVSFGKYGGEMPSYEVYIDGEPISIAAHDVYITLLEDQVIYKSEHVELSGGYTVFKQNKNEYVIKAQLTNGKSINYELEFTWNKKEDKIYITPRNGQAAAILEHIGV